MLNRWASKFMTVEKTTGEKMTGKVRTRSSGVRAQPFCAGGKL